ncbi:type III secretion system inner membrane ring lipoprotein SctJ [Aestuariibius sp. 2305UL40-4]|uniref:type III secretion system inner membrane ring lipoprotein SctJ n=1 Tax=Aestuariibius violaceus TaxID=3234132 RepID=UPI00345EAC26
MRTRHLARLALLVTVLAVAGCKSELYSDLDEQEANEIISVLLRHNIDADRQVMKGGQITVLVDDKRFADAVELLREQGYPKRHYATLGDVFQGDGFVVSPMEERARFVFAMSEELSRTISDIDGVLSARTHVVLPTSDRLSQDKTPSSASVFVRHDASVELQPLVPQIKLLVANSIEGLTYDKVTVVLVPAQIVTHAALPVAPTALSAVEAAGLGAALVLVLGLLIGGGAFLWRRGRTGHDGSFLTTPAE